MKSLRSFLHKGKRGHESVSKTRVHEFMHPGREWIVGLSAAVILFVCGSLYLGYDFLDQYKGIDEQATIDGSVVRYRKQDAVHFLEQYRNKKAVFSTLRAERSFIPVTEEVPEVSTASSTESVNVPLAEEGGAQ